MFRSGRISRSAIAKGSGATARFNPLRNARARAERILREKGAETTFELNPGGHFSDPVGRLAKGIRWILQQ